MYLTFSPDYVEDGRYEELVVDGHSHVPRLVERRGDGAYSVAQVHAPQQEQELRWEEDKKQKRGLEDTNLLNLFFCITFLHISLYFLLRV